MAGVFIGVGIAHQVWGPGSEWSSGMDLPTPRSKAVPEPFVLPGLAGDVREVLLEPDTFLRTEQLARLFSELGPDALEDVRSAYDSVLLDTGDTELVLFGEWWAGFAPRDALDWTEANWNARQSIPVIRGIMRAWGRTDPRFAIQAATMAAPNDAQRRLWVDYVLRGWDESVIDGALSYAKALGHGPERQWALTVLIRRRVMRDGPADVIAWAESLPDRDDDQTFKLNVYRRVAGAVAEVDTDLARAFVDRHMEGRYGHRLPERLGSRWVLREPEAAMAWAVSLPPGEARDETVLETYRAWLAWDRPAAQAWVQAQPADRPIEGAVALYARSISLVDPPAALDLAMGLTSEKLRMQTVGKIARQWYLREPEAADAWLASSGLPEDFVRKVRIVPDNPRVRKALGKT